VYYRKELLLSLDDKMPFMVSIYYVIIISQTNVLLNCFFIHLLSSAQTQSLSVAISHFAESKNNTLDLRSLVRYFAKC